MRWKDDKSNYSFLGGLQLLHGASIPLLIIFIGVYGKPLPLCFSQRKQIIFQQR